MIEVHRTRREGSSTVHARLILGSVDNILAVRANSRLTRIDHCAMRNAIFRVPALVVQAFTRPALAVESRLPTGVGGELILILRSSA